MNEAFSNFINFQKCTHEEYELAKAYALQNDEIDEFFKVCFKIVKKVLTKMYSVKYPTYKVGRKIYTYYGLTDEDFYHYYKLYINEYMSLEDKEKYRIYIDFKALENVWMRAKDCFWSREGLEIIAKDNNSNITSLRELINYYFRYVLKFENSDILKYKRKFVIFKKYLAGNVDNDKDFNDAYLFYTTYANAQEKEEYQAFSLQLINNVLEHLDDDINAYLFSINLNILNLYLLVTLFRKDLVTKVLNGFKPYYDFCNSNLWSKFAITEEAKKLNLTYEIYRDIAKMYATKVLGISNINDVIIQAVNTNNRLKYSKADIMKKIYESTNEDEYLALIADNKIALGDINYFCYNYNKDLSKDAKKEMEKNLLQKYYKYIENKRNAKRIYTREVIEEFLNSSLSLEQFCEKYGFNSSGLGGAIRALKDQQLLQRYHAKLNFYSDAYKECIKGITSSVLNYIKYGFISDGVTYPFWLIDFFVLCSGISPILLNTGFLPKEEAMIIRRFFLPLNKAEMLAKNSIAKATISKAIDFNGMKFLKTFTHDELEEIISFMNTYKIPFNDLLFHQACIRYATNTLSIYMDDSKALK